VIDLVTTIILNSPITIVAVLIVVDVTAVAIATLVGAIALTRITGTIGIAVIVLGLGGSSGGEKKYTDDKDSFHGISSKLRLRVMAIASSGRLNALSS
jgi:hypothetical protein